MSLIINGKDLLTDFQSYIAERLLENPKRKSITAKIPFSNVIYDFSKVDGELYFEPRKLDYTIDIAELSATEMETKRSALIEWLFAVFDDDIFDPYLNGYHMHGTFDADGWNEDFDAGQLTVSFLCYPYKIANTATENTFTITSGNNAVSITNDGSHPVVPTLTLSGSMNITVNGSIYAVGAGTITDEKFKLLVGANAWTVTGSGTLKVSFKKEVL